MFGNTQLTVMGLVSYGYEEVAECDCLRYSPMKHLYKRVCAWRDTPAGEISDHLIEHSLILSSVNKLTQDCYQIWTIQMAPLDIQLMRQGISSILIVFYTPFSCMHLLNELEMLEGKSGNTFTLSFQHQNL